MTRSNRIVLCRLLALQLCLASGPAQLTALATQPSGLSKAFEGAVQSRLKVLNKNRQQAGKEAGGMLAKATRVLNNGNPEQLQWYERARHAAEAWGGIIADEIALLEGLRTEGPRYGSLSRHGDDAVRRAQKFSLQEQGLAALEEGAIKRLAASRSQPANAERDKAIETELLFLHRARVALEENRLTLEFVLLNSGRHTLAQIQQRQQEQTAAFQAYYKRYKEEGLRDMQIGGAFLGGLILLGAFGDAFKSIEALNEIRRWTCETQMRGVYVIPGDPKTTLGHCV